MKKPLHLLSFIFCLILFSFGSQGQTGINANVDLELVYNYNTGIYEVYMIADEDIDISPTTPLNAFLGQSQVTVVLPSSATDNTLNSITCFDPCGSWVNNQSTFAPSPAAPGLDFYAILNTGGSIAAEILANQPVLLFTFQLGDGCVDGARLFRNNPDSDSPAPGTAQFDPNSSSPGMAGGDYRNSLEFQWPGSTPDQYRTNINNDGIVCDIQPIANADMTTTDEDTPVTIPVGANDMDGNDPHTTSISSLPSNGMATINDNGTPNDLTDDFIDYTPDPDFNGMDTLVYEVCDTDNDCDTALVVITINPVMDPPVANPDVTTTPEETPVTINSTDNDTDPDDNLDPTTADTTCAICTGPMNGTLVVNGDGTFTYTPDPNFNGDDSFIYEVCDTDLQCDTALVTITVDPTNDPPVVPDEMTTTPEDTPVEICVDPTDPDVGDIVSGAGIDASCGPNNGTLSPGSSDLCYIYLPDPDFNGMDTFCVIVCDDGNPVLCDTAEVIVTVNPVNDAPIAVDDATTTDEDTPVTVSAPGVLTNDSDPDGDPLDLNTTPITDPSNGTAVVNDDGSFTYTPDMNFNGMDTFSYEICDVTVINPQPLCDTAEVVITVNPGNDPPVVPDEMTTTDEDTPVDVCVDPTDPDVGDVVSGAGLDASCGPNNGTLSPGATDLCYIYTPDPDFNGMDTFCVIVCDNGNPVLCDTAEVIVTVNPVNDAPIAVDDATTTDEDTPVTVSAPGVLTNDSDPDGDPLDLNTTPITDPSNGTVVVNDDGSFTYTPDMNFNGMDTFSYEICDVTVINPQPLCDTAEVVITVNPGNDPPVVPDEMTTTDEDTPVEVCVDPTDPDVGDVVSGAGLDASCGPNNGTLTPGATDLCYIYTPDPDFNGMDTFCVIVCDDGNPVLCDTAEVIVTVNPVNDAPIAVDDATTTDEDTPVTVSAPGVLTNDSDPDGDPLDLNTTPITDPSNGTVVVNDDGSFTYTPDMNFNGMDTFSYEICDVTVINPQPLCDTAEVVITINPGNDPPVVPDEMTTTDEDTPVEVCVDPTDPDVGDVVSGAGLDASCGPNNGTLTPGATDLCYIYTPDPDFNGMDTFCVIVCDDGNPVLCDTAEVIVTVNPVNDAPIAVDDATTTDEDTPVTVSAPGVLTNDSDPDGDPLDLNTTPITDASNGTVVVNDDGSFTYTPDMNFNGMDTFSYEICDETIVDPQPLCDTAEVVITVDPGNDPPVAPDEMTMTPEETPVEVCVDPTDPDIGDVVSGAGLDVSCGPNNGTLSPGATDLCYVYTPDEDFNGMDTFCVIVCDDGNPVLCDTAEIVVTVTPVNDAPVAMDDATTTTEDQPVTVNAPGVIANDIDPDGDPMMTSTTPVSDPMNGTVTINDDGSFTYDPDPNFFGMDTFEYEVCDVTVIDPQPLCDTAQVVITIVEDNDPPVVPDEMTMTPEETPVEVCVDPTDPDVGNVVSGAGLDVSCGPNNGTLTPGATDLCYIYTPNDDFNGMDTFCIVVCDDGMPVLCDTAQVIVTVTPVNDPPVALPDTFYTPEDTPITMDIGDEIIDNDIDIDGMIVENTLSVLQTPNNGDLNFNPLTGEITYTPDPNFNGVDSFIYEICDNGSPVLCDDTTVYIIITPVNDPPVANQDFTVTEEDEAVCIVVIDNDNDNADNAAVDPSSVAIIIAPPNGTITNIDGTTGEICYQPDPGFSGTDVFHYVVCDTGVGLPVPLCDTTQVFVSITDVNDPPVAVDDMTSTDEDTPVTIHVLDNDEDPDGDIDPSTLDTVPGTGPMNGTVEILPTGDIVYTPDPNFNGIDSFDYVICDDGMPSPVLCDTATVYVTVDPVNDPPVVPDEMTMTPEDEPVDVCVNPSDIDGDNVSVMGLACEPSNGTVEPLVGNDLCFTYTPDPNFTGMDTFCVIVCDDGVPILCDTNEVIITVTPVNDPPIAVDDMSTTDEDTPVTVDPLANDMDPDGMLDPMSVDTIPGTGPMNGTVVINPNGTIDYTPDPNFNGVDSFDYVICDDGVPAPVLCDTATVIITIDPVNDLPTAVDDDMEMTNEGDPIVIDVLPNDDFGGDGPSDGPIQLVDPLSAGDGMVFVDDNGTPNDPTDDMIDYIPAPGFFGLDSFDYFICDIDNECDTATVYVDVLPTDVRLNLRVMLQGALFDTDDGLMRDDLRTGGYIPLTEPYSAFTAFSHVGPGGTETIDDSLAVLGGPTGPDAIVDWVFVELRDANDPTNVVATRSGLVQRDGDVVDLDGVSALLFESNSPAQYFVSVRHRNHMGAMTATAIPLTASGTLVDFTIMSAGDTYNNTSEYDGVEQVNVGGIEALWAGNSNQDGKVKYQGGSNDPNAVLADVLFHPDNSSNGFNFDFGFGYWNGDVDMNGKAKYQGANNDVNRILNNVLFYPLNTTFGFNYDFMLEQLP